MDCFYFSKESRIVIEGNESMSILMTGLVSVGVVGVMAYHRLTLKQSSLILLLLAAGYLAVILKFHHTPHPVLAWCNVGLLLIILFVINISVIRQKFITGKIFSIYKKAMPTISSTEREALEAGTVGFVSELFNGKPDWRELWNIPAPVLSPEEKAFIEGPVEELCQMLDEWKVVSYDMELSKSTWDFIKNNGFFGLIIPKEYGGKAFSAFAHAEIVSKIYGVSSTAGTTVSVPNSLGPAELLLHYGTPEQKNYYLPRLAKGEEIPCFALTSPSAGSDATSITDSGVICKGIFNEQEVLGIRLNWNKRYITLAPCATVMGMAFKLSDPEHLLSSGITEYGITCALIPTHLPGITIGRRHFPLGSAFLNGPTQGKDVFVPLDYIIGGVKMAGHGWRMLIECLAAGRSISLPSTMIGGSKMGVYATGAYAKIRQQFHLPIGKFEGVSEVLSRMTGYLYLMESCKKLTMSIIDQGQKPAILSSIMKYHITELGRKIAVDAMDVHGGKGICMGPKNYLAKFYQTVPIAITVEGANILTRSLIIFGQGSLRCHQYFLKEFYAGEKNDLPAFDKAIWGHLGLLVSNTVRSVWLGLTGARLVSIRLPGNNNNKIVRKNYQQLTRYCSAFALLADISVLLLGGTLKRKEKLSARLGDILSYLFFISAVLKNYQNDGMPTEDSCFVSWICEQYFFEIQEKIDHVLQNYPHPIASKILRFILLPLGKTKKPPQDKLSQQLTDKIMSLSESRERLTQNMFKGGLMGELETVFQKVIEAESKQDKVLGEEARQWVSKIIAVDDFEFNELKKQ